MTDELLKTLCLYTDIYLFVTDIEKHSNLVGWRKQRKESGARKNLLNTSVRMARSYGFFAQCFLFAFIMYFSQL